MRLGSGLSAGWVGVSCRCLCKLACCLYCWIRVSCRCVCVKVDGNVCAAAIEDYCGGCMVGVW